MILSSFVCTRKIKKYLLYCCSWKCADLQLENGKGGARPMMMRLYTFQKLRKILANAYFGNELSGYQQTRHRAMRIGQSVAPTNAIPIPIQSKPYVYSIKSTKQNATMSVRNGFEMTIYSIVRQISKKAILLRYICCVTQYINIDPNKSKEIHTHSE